LTNTVKQKENLEKNLSNQKAAFEDLSKKHEKVIL
jgi:hypothetical protein